MVKPVSIFISYSHSDENERMELRKQLMNIRPALDIWDDREIKAGDQWDHEIGTSLDSADIMLMLVSDDFLLSQYVQTYEIPKAIKRQEDDEVKVIPILLKQCRWQGHGLDQNQALPADGEWVVSQSLTTGEDFLNKKILLTVIDGIEDVAKELQEHRQQHFDKLETYRSKVAETLSDNKISKAERDTLNELREEKGITIDEALAIEQGETKSIDAKLEAQAKYKRTLRSYLDDGGYPLSEEGRDDMKQRQRDLGLGDDHITGIEDETVDEWRTSKTLADTLAEQERNERAARERDEQEKETRRQEEEKRRADKQAEDDAAAELQRAADEKIAREKAEQAERDAKELATRQAREQALLWGSEVCWVLTDFARVVEDLMVLPNLPKRLLKTAAETCNVPDHEIVLGFISDEATFVFGLQGVYAHHPRLDVTVLNSYSSWAKPAPEPANDEADLSPVVLYEWLKDSTHFLPLVQILIRLRQLTAEFADQIDAVAVHVELDAEELTSIRDELSEAVKASSAVRTKQRKRWVRALTKYLGDTSCVVQPNISAKKAGNAAAEYAIPLHEVHIGLIDTTVFGSAKDGLMFGADAIYLHNASGASAGTHSVQYSELTGGDIKVVSYNLDLDGRVSLNLAPNWAPAVIQGVRDLYLAVVENSTDS